MENLLKRRLLENKENFTENETNIILNDLSLFAKIYALGIADCVKVFEKEEVK